MFAGIQMYIMAGVAALFLALGGFAYWQYEENLASSAKNAQLSQQVKIQEFTISSLTAQAAEIARKHEVLNEKFQAAEQQLQKNLALPDAEIGQDDTAIDGVGRQIERGTR